MLYTAHRHGVKMVTRQQQEASFPLSNSSSLSNGRLKIIKIAAECLAHLYQQHCLINVSNS